MQQRSPPRSCPSCKGDLSVSSDMWGHFYSCENCGFTAEDDDEIKIPHNVGTQLIAEVSNANALLTGERRQIA